MQASILYHSATGTTKQCAEFIAEGMARTPNLETRLMALGAVDKEFLEASSCVILGSPTYLAAHCCPI